MHFCYGKDSKKIFVMHGVLSLTWVSLKPHHSGISQQHRVPQRVLATALYNRTHNDKPAHDNHNPPCALRCVRPVSPPEENQ
jgi:hypothetical protein